MKKFIDKLRNFKNLILEINRNLYFLVLKKRIKNKDFSLICNCCIAGTFYHNLKMEFLSPTIGLSIDNKSFIKFVKNLKYYLSLELIEETNNLENCPVGYLGDIKIVFRHYKSFSEASDAWNRRKTRINFSNIYIVMRDLVENNVTVNDAEDLSQYCKNLIIFKRIKIKNNYFKKLHVKNDEQEYFVDRFNFRHWEKEFNWVKFLNKKI